MNIATFSFSRFFVIVLMMFVLSACENKQEPVSISTPTAELVNTYWRLLELNGNTVITPEGQREMKLTLREESKLTGYAGCNSFFGSYQTSESMLTFSQLAASRKFCDKTMDNESLFLKSLSSVSSFNITGNKLKLVDSEEKVLAEFEAIYLQ